MYAFFFFFFKVVLSASLSLSEEDLRRFGSGFAPNWDTDCDHLFHKAASQLSERNDTRGHVVLILDKVSLNTRPALCCSDIKRV